MPVFLIGLLPKLLANWKLIIAGIAVLAGLYIFHAYTVSVEEATAARIAYEQTQEALARAQDELKKAQELKDAEIKARKNAENKIKESQRINSLLLDQLKNKKDGPVAEVLLDTLKELEKRK